MTKIEPASIEATVLPGLELAKADFGRLKACENVIQSGMATFVAVGMALAEIRDSQLYLAAHHSFDAYCRERWNMAARTAYQTIESGRIVRALGDVGSSLNESQARVLATVPEQERKAALLGAIADMQDLTAAKLKTWLLRRSHIRQPIADSSGDIECPHCGMEFQRSNLLAASRGNRQPSKAPTLMLKHAGRKLASVIDYGCGRLRNALEIERITDRATYCDLPEQVQRIAPISDERTVLSVPITITAEAVLLLNVAHIQPTEGMRRDVLQAAAACAERWLLVETPACQSYYRRRKTGTAFAFLSTDAVAGMVPMKLIKTRWTNAHNRALIFER